MNTQELDKLEIDTGTNILTLDLFKGKRGSPIVTAYVGGISLRCGSLHIDRIKHTFVDSILAACDVGEDKEAEIEEATVGFLNNVTL